MREQKRLCITYGIILIISGIFSFLLEYVQLNSEVVILTGHRSFYVSFMLSIVTGCILGIVISVIGFKSKKQEYIIHIMTVTMDIYHYLLNFNNIEAVDNKAYLDFEKSKCSLWYQEIMSLCDQYSIANELVVYQTKKEKKVLSDLNDLKNEIYKECNCLKDQIFIHNQFETDIKETKLTLIGQRDYLIEKRQFIVKVKGLMTSLSQVYNVRINLDN